MNKTTVAEPAKTVSSLSSTQAMLQRQCACGNHTPAGGECEACAKKKKGMQRKLNIGASNDPLEQEADRMAEQVMAVPLNSVTNSIPPRIQRFTEQANEGSNTAPASVDRVLEGSGRPLEPALQQDMGQRFGHDFSQVRVHTGSAAGQSARDVGAKAYTVGNNVVFGAGQYAPGSNEGRHLLAHELTHVVQQAGRQSLFIQRACGPAADTIGAAGGCTPAPSVFVAGSIFRFNVDCNDFASGQEAALASHARAQPASATFKIHGYTSTDGAASFNQNLACARIIKARSVLSGAGVAARITAELNHGPTAGPAAERRSVVIETSTPAPGPAPAPAPGPAPVPPAPAPSGVITSQTVATSPGGRTRTTIGVGEEVDLTYSLGSTTWTTTAGTFNFVSGNPGPLVRLTAPDTSRFVTVRAGTASILFTVIAPNNVHMDRLGSTGVKHTINQADVGIATQPFLLPDSVSFYNVVYRELDVNATATSPFRCGLPLGHCGAGGGGAPCPDLSLTNTVVAGKGTQAISGDCAYVGSCGTTPPYDPVTITLLIPYEYKVGTGSYFNFTTVSQVHQLAADASTLTASKAGANGATTVASPTVTIPGC